ncbi:MAG: spherulation-specific family 4 protein [Akkermansiaceae bacterium]|nr:spherulation-specific family 4 protein [Armatimonadota bacterium]
MLGLLLTLAALPSLAQKPGPKDQGMVVPAYFAPGPLWEQMGTAAANTGMIAIMNPNSGPGDAAREDYVAQIKTARAQGVKVLGYVHTSYGKRPIAEVRAEIERYYQWYAVSGIFFDEVTNDDKGLAYYAKCRRLARASDAKGLVIVNPGTPVTKGYMNVADIVVTFESNYDAYIKRAPDAAWVRTFPAKRFWHLIYAAPDENAMKNAVQLTKKRNAGWVFVTPDTLPNPWDTLPEEPYWAAQLAAFAAPKKP